jgi:hypothetical protein
MTELAWKAWPWAVAPPSLNTRSTIWQLANQENRIAMALLQKKAAARGKKDDNMIGPTAYPSVPAAGMEVLKNELWQLKIACLNVAPPIVPYMPRPKERRAERR